MDNGRRSTGPKFFQSRRVYLSIAARLRAGEQLNRDDEFLHTYIAESLRHDIIESDIMLNVSLSHMIAIASLYGNEESDLEKGSTQINRMIINAQTLIPYLTAGKTADDLMNEERMALVERYKKMQLQAKDNGLSPKEGT